MNNEIYFLEQRLTELLEKSKEFEIQKENMEKRIARLDQVYQALNLLKSAKVKSKKDFILKIINTALQDIFDQNISIDIHSTDEDEKMIKSKSNSIKIKYDIILYENGIEIGRNEKLLSSNGGGVLSVISILMKILTGYIHSQNKFYILDESLAQVSAIYQERLSLFLRTFCEQYGFTIILITHNPKLSEHTHLEYTLGAKKLSSGLKSLHIIHKNKNFMNYKPQEIWEIEITNFQSIENLKIDFAGFVSITGSNNIGKSAIVRAINSTIFNAFEQNYLRQDAKEASVRIDNGAKWVKMTYSNKIIYYEFWDGEKFTGKKLAQEKIEEKMQEIGFRYLNISKMYKNWKADLKEQTDRLYITTQHDKMFLIGSKTSDSDKIFNFLFNAESIARAINECAYDLREANGEYKEISESLSALEKNIEIISLELEIKKLQYLISSVKEYKELRKKFKHIVAAKSIYSQLLEKYSELIDLIKIRSEYLRAVSYNRKLKNAVAKVKKIYDILALVYGKISELNYIQSMLSGSRELNNKLSEIQKYKKYAMQFLDTISAILDKLLQLSQLLKYRNQINVLRNQKKQLIENKNKLANWWQEIQNKLNIIPCECCRGTGYQIKGEQNGYITI